jgi:UDP-glucose 4-epimerase
MRVLVTGGAGFIGSQVADRFLAMGHEVMIIDDLSSTGDTRNVPAKATFVKADIRSQESMDAIRSFAPVVISHHAAQMDVRKSVADPAHDADINVVGLLRTFEAARMGGKLEHIIFASSGGAMYGEQDTYPAPENHAVRPESPYGLAKSVGEQYLEWYKRAHKVTSTSLRYGNVYGPRQSPHGEAGVVAIFCGRILDNKPLTIFGDGKQTRDYVFIDDVVDANARALDKRPHGGFNIGTGIETDVVAIAQALIRRSGKQIHVQHAEARQGEQRRSVIDANAFAHATGWRARTSVEHGLAHTYDWFAGHTR